MFVAWSSGVLLGYLAPRPARVQEGLLCQIPCLGLVECVESSKVDFSSCHSQLGSPLPTRSEFHSCRSVCKRIACVDGWGDFSQVGPSIVVPHPIPMIDRRLWHVPRYVQDGEYVRPVKAAVYADHDVPIIAPRSGQVSRFHPPGGCLSPAEDSTRLVIVQQFAHALSR